MATQIKTTQEKIDYLLNHFDFEQVHKVMNFLDWKWATSENDNAIPSMAELRQCARRLLTDAFREGRKLNGVDSYDYSISTGGFKASVIKYEDGMVEGELSFELATWDTFR